MSARKLVPPQTAANQANAIAAVNKDINRIDSRTELLRDLVCQRQGGGKSGMTLGRTVGTISTAILVCANAVIAARLMLCKSKLRKTRGQSPVLILRTRSDTRAPWTTVEHVIRR